MKPSPEYKTFVLAVFLCFLLVLSACDSERKTNVSEGTKNQVLHIGNGTEPQDVDPHIVTGVPEHRIITALMEGLVTEDPKDLSPRPGMAVSWTASPDQKTYTFAIRRDAKWSNGDAFTAHDFVYSWNRLLSPGLGAEYAYQLFCVENAEKYSKGEIVDFKKVGVKALDDYTFEVRLANPTPYFLSLLTHYSTFPVNRKTIEKFGKIDTRGTKWTRPGNHVGNGPFILKKWELNKIMVVEKNPGYWNAAAVRLKEIHFHPIDNKQTEERMFRSGQIHLTNSVPSEKIDVYKEKNPHLLKITPYLGTYYYLINTSRNPFDDPRVRRALAMSIDRRMIVEKVSKGEQIPAHAYTPPGTQGYTPEASIPFDIEKARKLLAQAGYPDGKGFPVRELLYNTSEDHRKIAIAIQQMWKTALNLDISLINQEWKVYLSSRKTKNYDLGRAGWIGDYADPNTFLDMFVTNGGNNHTGWSNQTYDDLIAQAAQTIDREKRYRIFQKAEKILLDEAPIIPIYTYTNTFLISPDVKGWYPNILDHHPYQYVHLSSK
ncbi:MAG: peptide ABC transporter substrate-binding protein [Proteobacteria bacterium]|nr:peptide ABC transporter substrate-binding protein [Pseudomonadota bacterium]